jgi:predicted HicB family RNase H-like nuclease
VTRRGQSRIDVVTFEGRSAEEAERAFRDSVDDYLEMFLSRT